MTDTPDLTVISGDKDAVKARKAREAKEKVGPSEDGKHPKLQLYRTIASFMDHRACFIKNHHPDLAINFHPKMVKSGTGALFGLIAPEKTLLAVDQNEIESRLIKWLAEEATQVKEYRCLTVADIHNIFRTWTALTDRIEEDGCDIIGENLADLPCGVEQAKWAWNRVRWPRRLGVTPQEFPLISEALSRMDCPDQFCAWVGSIFDKDSPQSQYMWLYGEGGNGKSAMVNLIGWMCGTAHASVRKPTSSDLRFWSTCLVGKRFVSFGDLNSFKFPTQDTFKMLTGDRLIPMEEKWGKLMSVHLPCKYIFTSNMMPQITDSMADRRRVIFSKMDPITCEPDGGYEERIKLEGEAFLNYCRELYDRTNVKGFIKMPEDIVDSLVDPMEGSFQDTFDRSMELDTRQVERESDRWMIPDGELNAFLGRGRAVGSCGMSTQTRDRFKGWLKKRVQNKKVRLEDGTTARRWVGVRFKPGNPEDVGPRAGYYED